MKPHRRSIACSDVGIALGRAVDSALRASKTAKQKVALVKCWLPVSSQEVDHYGARGISRFALEGAFRSYQEKCKEVVVISILRARHRACRLFLCIPRQHVTGFLKTYILPT